MSIKRNRICLVIYIDYICGIFSPVSGIIVGDSVSTTEVDCTVESLGLTEENSNKE